MASTLGATALSSVAARFSLPRRTPIAALSSKLRPLSLPSTEVSSSPTPLLPLRPPSTGTRVTRKWKLCAASDETLEPEEAPPAVPEPVEEQLAASTATEAAKGEDVFAVVMVGSRQYIVFPGRFIYTQRLKDANVDDKIILNKVLLVGTRTKAYIGQPVVTNAAVHAVVEEQGLDRKVIVFKYKKKKNYRRNIGHRQPRTRIRITGITGYQDFPAETMPKTFPA
ncbi:large ribosomal subunit protein bL21c [Musa acuminata AAA Group]|uniref:large ribosomal subunit protein bL21c n=1 Tax=Musa acuminata AAA Group TaxID=214697 RepID=UPI0031D4D336